MFGSLAFDRKLKDVGTGTLKAKEVSPGNWHTINTLVAQKRKPTYTLCLPEANNGSSTTLSDLGGIAAGTCYFEVKESAFIITWQLEGAPVLRHDSNDYSSKVVGRHTSTIGENGRVAELSIADITFEDSGTYTCAKSYLVEGLPEEYKWILHVQGKPEIEQKNIPVESENDVVAECCLQYSNHHYHPTFSWL
ncbi:hypothetical protein BSL78_27075 [Apostichopus japonicus]|uniref:Ig-like domain-containing protein n=1 Tax=Stichopus japonicus TaxID=307972 RepID=A0A2G8JK34_STIJA|nr:hypothetical protein BSL78_27075 [Apostichopus japonicus]